MFDIAWSEIMLIAVVALVVIGPKDLPKAIFTLGKWVRKARVVAREFQGHLDDMMREAELDELRREALKTREMNLKKMMEDTVDPKNELRQAFDVGLDGHAGSPAEADEKPAAPAAAAPAAGSATSPAASPATVSSAPPPAAVPAPASSPSSSPAPAISSTAPAETSAPDKQA
ncbi:Sec-independent protein translocase protein TatB [Azospirillum thermophilum]|uniref:Sec-independent protein translocase protein TatB n=1 Tax=Azospirillum thermophilum TaxID=2202148 RepID=A0A2S2CLD7_9PROT|nr:Sec-independent protein translocase protein TatB [Azospirillum thermophilum]AWK85127.1 twin-arginine translocase subunit TatB [Azospirillum thermophilum]